VDTWTKRVMTGGRKVDWQVRITQLLIAGGTTGVRQGELISKVKKDAGDGEVLAFLRVLAAEKKVQKFILPGQIAVWRATSNIERL
jgi:hypothetical protein